MLLIRIFDRLETVNVYVNLMIDYWKKYGVQFYLNLIDKLIMKFRQRCNKWLHYDFYVYFSEDISQKVALENRKFNEISMQYWF